MASYDLKAILGEKLKRLTDKTLKALVDCMCTVGASLCSLDKRVSALESVELPEGGYKPMQEPLASPSASGTAIQFIDSMSQDATGRMTATKKTVRTGSTSQTGVLQLTDSHASTSTTTAATPKNVKEAYDLANTANTGAVKNVAYDSTNKKITKTINGTTSDVVSVATLKTDMALNNVDNTSDANKPVSTAQQAALDTKADSRCFHNEKLDTTNQVTNFLKMTFSGRVGRSSAVVAIASNNGDTSSLFMLSWFHDGSSIGSVKADLISCGDEGQKPLVYYSTDSIFFGIGNSGNIVSTISLMVSCENPSNISYSQVTRAVATASPNVNISLSRDTQLKSNLVTSLIPAYISDTYYPSSKAVDDSLKSISKCHVEALVVPVTPDQYGFVNVGLYRRGYSEPVLVPTTYDSVKDSYYIASGDFSALVYTVGVFNPTIAYGCEEFYVDFTWTGAVTKTLSLYDFFGRQETEYLRHFAFTINNYCGYALTLQIYGGINKPNIDIYSNLRAMTNTLNVACAANRVTRIDVRLRNLGVNTSGAKSVVVVVT